MFIIKVVVEEGPIKEQMCSEEVQAFGDREKGAIQNNVEYMHAWASLNEPVQDQDNDAENYTV